MFAIILLLILISLYVSKYVDKPTTPPPKKYDDSAPVRAKLKASQEGGPARVFVPREYSTGFGPITEDCCSGNTCLPYTINSLRNQGPDEWECDMLQFFEHI